MVFSCLPRMRGDRPKYEASQKQEKKFTPHARGSTYSIRLIHLPQFVYPACAGIDPVMENQRVGQTRLPRMRGDRPPSSSLASYLLRFTPHARGSTAHKPRSPQAHKVYPACAGIDLFSKLFPWFFRRLPRMRGDRPGKLHDATYTQ